MLGILKQVNTFGVDLSDPYAQDDIVVTEFIFQRVRKFILK
jgi:hypothetical protein